MKNIYLSTICLIIGLLINTISFGQSINPSINNSLIKQSEINLHLDKTQGWASPRMRNTGIGFTVYVVLALLQEE